MKKKKYIPIIIILIALVAVIVIITSNRVQISGWREFEKGALNNYSFVEGVNVDSIVPPRIRIVYRLNRKIEMNEVDDIFTYTKKYILTENVFKDLQEFHKKKFKYSFGIIKIELFYWENYNKGKKFNCIISGSQDVDGEPNYNNFTIWDIEYDNEPVKTYIP